MNSNLIKSFDVGGEALGLAENLNGVVGSALSKYGSLGSVENAFPMLKLLLPQQEVSKPFSEIISDYENGPSLPQQTELLYAGIPTGASQSMQLHDISNVFTGLTNEATQWINTINRRGGPF